MFKKSKISFLLIFISAFSFTSLAQVTTVKDNLETKEKKKKSKKVKLPMIDLSHWKVTVPIANEEGKPYEVEPPEILNYPTNEALKPYMYNDSLRGAIVFHAFPSESTTRNTKYSRSELREQMVPGDN
ncbi:polysaccharide lyase family 7 protein, partial [Flavobacteriaceae bacterium]|nr:polysaccharide lyase family 7 protein [Flavobacteriaceae bacterium]